MHSLALQWILQSLQQQFRCPECGESPQPKNIEIDNIQWEKLHAKITCHKCWLRSVLYAEVNESIQKIIDAKTAADLIEKMIQNPEKTLSDQDIQDVKNTLKDSKNISDFI